MDISYSRQCNLIVPYIANLFIIQSDMNYQRMKVTALISDGLLCNALAFSQPPSSSSSSQLKEGTDVQLKFAEALSSKTAAEGDPVTFILDEDLKAGEVIVARAGCKAFGEVTNSKKSGMMGKAGELNVRLNYLKVGDQKVKLRGTKGKEGDDKVGATVVLTVVFGPIGLIKHGKNIEIKEGTALHTYVADDISLPPA